MNSDLSYYMNRLFEKWSVRDYNGKINKYGGFNIMYPKFDESKIRKGISLKNSKEYKDRIVSELKSFDEA